MAEFLTTHKTASQLEDLIINANRNLVLISPYLQISEMLLMRLKQANDRRVNITIVYGKDELRVQERDKLSELNRLKLYYLDKLHAKCYYNETQMIITSMNMYEFSEKNNREMGVLIDYKIDKPLYDKAIAEANSFINGAIEQNIKKERVYINDYKNHQDFFESNTAKEKAPTKKVAFCIRCSEAIKYNTSKPYCSNCYDTWAKFENYDYIENVCHCCGKENETTMNKPQCAPCFRKMKNVN